MIGIVGIIMIFVMVFGGYLAAGGKMGIILKSLPFEMTMIGGAAAGADGVGDVVFNHDSEDFPILNGDDAPRLLDTEGNQLKVDGEDLFLYVSEDGKTLWGKTSAEAELLEMIDQHGMIGCGTGKTLGDIFG